MPEILESLGAVPPLSPDVQWRRWVRRYTWHLDQLPGLVEAMRSDVLPIGAAVYDRDRVDQSRDAPVPFRVEVVDAIDDLWAALVEYADNVDELLQVHAPVVLAPLPHVGRWRSGSGVQGARAGADVRADAFTLIGWLIERVDWILPLQALDDSEEFLFSLIRQNANRFMRPRPVPKAACRVCGTHAVSVRWTATAEVVECSRCGDVQVMGARRPLLSEACAGGPHEACAVMSCACSCHERRSSLYTVRVRVGPVSEGHRLVAPFSESCAHSEWPAYVGDDGLRHCGGCGVLL